MTQDDLYAFHARLFGSPAPKQLFCTEQDPYNDACYEDIFEVENDDLGYYPDGVKRTLTDDQIAMFRHSEIYSILRERQVRKENLEAEGGEGPETMLSQPEEAVEATMFLEEEGEVHSEEELKEVLATVPETPAQQAGVMRSRKKHKREDTDTGYVYGKTHASRSARGFVRELDSVVAEDHILDYGDEPSVTEESKHDGFPATTVAEQGRESQAHPIEGKKIWWPIIEAT